MIPEIISSGQGTVSIEPVGKGNPISTRTLSLEYHMLEDLLGNGQAKINVSVESSHKSYGQGFSIHASLSLTCNQDDDTVAAAFQYARTVLLTEVEKTIPEAQEMYLASTSQ